MAFSDIVKQQRLAGKSITGSLGSAAMGSAKENLDIRNYLFKSGSLLNLLFPKVKGFNFSDKSSKSLGKKLSSSENIAPSNDMFDIVAKNAQITAKNSLVLPSMARDMFLVKKNIIQLVKLQGGTPTTKTGEWFQRQLSRENSYESRFGRSRSMSPERVGTSDKKSDDTTSLFGGLFSKFTKAIGSFTGGGLLGVLGTLASSLLPLIAIAAGLGFVLDKLALGIKSLYNWIANTSIGKSLGLKPMSAGEGFGPFGREKSTGTTSSDEPTSGRNTIVDQAVDAAAITGMTAGGVVAAKGALKIKNLYGKTGNAVMDVKTMSVDQLSNSTQKSKWGRFLVFVAKKSPTLWGKIGLKLAQAGVLATIPVVGWIAAAVQLGFGLWTAWEIYGLWKEFTKTEENETTPTQITNEEKLQDSLKTPVETASAPATASPSAQSIPSSQQAVRDSKTPSKVSNTASSGSDLLEQVMDEEGIKDPEVRNRLRQIAYRESSMNPNAMGPVIPSGMHKGDQAHGLLQVMPKTASEMGFSNEDIKDPKKSAKAGVKYFLKNYNKFNNLDAATVAHHAGPGAGQKWLNGGSVNSKDLATGLKTTDYLKSVKGTTSEQIAAAPGQIAKSPESKTQTAESSTSQTLMSESLTSAFSALGSFGLSDIGNFAKDLVKASPEIALIAAKQIASGEYLLAGSKSIEDAKMAMSMSQPIVVSPTNINSPKQTNQTLSGTTSTAYDDDVINKLLDSGFAA